MGQAKQRGTYKQRLAQALAANDTLRHEIELQAQSPYLKFLKRHMDRNGVQKFRLFLGQHVRHES